MTLATLFNDLADHTEATARTLRKIAYEMSAGTGPLPLPATGSALERALGIHPSMGPRQRELITLVEGIGARGADTGELSRASGMSQPNVHLTLKGMMTRGLIRKDESQRPQRYYLGAALDARGA
jgi:hypothetical protein